MKHKKHKYPRYFISGSNGWISDYNNFVPQYEDMVLYLFVNDLKRVFYAKSNNFSSEANTWSEIYCDEKVKKQYLREVMVEELPLLGLPIFP